MSTATETKAILKGGEFLVKETAFETIFTKDEITEEQRMFAQTASDFIDNRVHPHVKRIDKQDFALVMELLKESAELGILGAAVPEEYGGMNLDINTQSVINEEMG